MCAHCTGQIYWLAFYRLNSSFVRPFFFLSLFIAFIGITYISFSRFFFDLQQVYRIRHWPRSYHTINMLSSAVRRVSIVKPLSVRFACQTPRISYHGTRYSTMVWNKTLKHKNWSEGKLAYKLTQPIDWHLLIGMCPLLFCAWSIQQRGWSNCRCSVKNPAGEAA